MTANKAHYDDKEQAIDIGKSPFGYYLDLNGERLLSSDSLEEIFARVQKEVKLAFGIPEPTKKKGGFFHKRR